LSNEERSNSQGEQPQRTALVRRANLEPWHDPQWQQLWLAIEARPWRSLCLIPAGEGGPIDFTLNLAVNLSRTGIIHIGTAIQVADATSVPLGQLNAFLTEVRRCTTAGERLLVALPPTGASPISTSIAQASDAAVLCVLLEKMSSADARRTLKVVGPARFIGSVMVHASQLAQSD
jgi:hypothetical protein